jgi:hypothetical protein
MTPDSDTLRVGIAQIAPVWLDRDATIDKVCTWIEGAARDGCELVAFGEALVPGWGAASEATRREPICLDDVDVAMPSERRGDARNVRRIKHKYAGVQSRERDDVDARTEWLDTPTNRVEVGVGPNTHAEQVVEPVVFGTHHPRQSKLFAVAA